MAERHKFTIDRATWARGDRGVKSTLLLDNQGMRCCLGFFLSSCGIPDEDQENVGHPSEIAPYCSKRKWPKAAEFLVIRDTKNNEVEGSPAETELIKINDNKDLSEEERERELTDQFAWRGVEVEFVGPRKDNDDGH